MKKKDIRTHITPDAFKVADSLLNTPLASPLRRAIALLVDLILIAFLSMMGFMFFWFFLAVILFREWLKKRRDKSNGLKFWRNLGLPSAACLCFLLSLISIALPFLLHEGLQVQLGANNDSGENETVSLSDLADSASSLNSDDNSVRTKTAEELVKKLSAYGMSETDVRDMFSAANGFSLINDEALETLNRTLTTEFQMAPAEGEDKKQLLEATRAFAVSLQADPPTDDFNQTRETLKEMLAAPDLKRRDERIKYLQQRLSIQLEEYNALKASSESFTFVIFFKALTTDMGLTLSWSLFYLTLLPAFFNGRTVGKRLLGLRIIRLDGRPLTLWNSFERAGGYSAGLATGLLGFIQIFWDANRQAIQDKIAGTAVIREKRQGVLP